MVIKMLLSDWVSDWNWIMVGVILVIAAMAALALVTDSKRQPTAEGVIGLGFMAFCLWLMGYGVGVLVCTW